MSYVEVSGVRLRSSYTIGIAGIYRRRGAVTSLLAWRLMSSSWQVQGAVTTVHVTAGFGTTPQGVTS